MTARLRFLAGEPALCAALAPLLLEPAGSQAALTLLREQPGHRRLLRAQLASGERVFLKRFAPGRHRIREAVKRTLGLEAARREWRALVSLHARGVRVPEPLALAALEGGELVIATRFLEGRTLKQTLAERPRGRRALLDAVGDLIASLHARRLDAWRPPPRQPAGRRQAASGCSTCRRPFRCAGRPRAGAIWASSITRSRDLSR